MPATRRDVLALCVQKGGIRKGRKVAQFIVEWELATRSYGRQISAEEFARWWKEGPATTYRRLALFRELFPELGERGKPGDLITLTPAPIPSPDQGIAGVLAT